MTSYVAVLFIRVHRSAIVNIDSIAQLDAISHGEFEPTLRDGRVARISRTYRALLEQRSGSRCNHTKPA